MLRTRRKFLIVFCLCWGIDQLRPGTVDHIEYSDEAQLTGVVCLSAGSHAHDGTECGMRATPANIGENAGIEDAIIALR
jgi:hypothetical protein